MELSNQWSPSDSDLRKMEIQEILFLVSKLREDIKERIWKFTTYSEAYTTRDLDDISDRLKELIKRHT